jgi:hypothetical protein
MSFLETYRQARDENRRRSEAGSRQNPIASAAGTTLGVGASLAAPLPVFKLGAGPLARIASGIATGLGYGAVASSGRSKADLTKGEFGKFARDLAGEKEFEQARKNVDEGGWRGSGKAALNVAAAGAPGGAVAGGALSTAMEGLRKAGPSIGRYAVRQGRRVLTNGADSQSNRALVSDEAVTAALDEGAIRNLGNTEGTLHRLEELTAKYGPEYRQIVTKLEDSGVAGPKASAIAEKLLERAVYLEKRARQRTRRPALQRRFPIAPRGRHRGRNRQPRGVGGEASAQYPQEPGRIYRGRQRTQAGKGPEVWCGYQQCRQIRRAGGGVRCRTRRASAVIRGARARADAHQGRQAEEGARQTTRERRCWRGRYAGPV